jgi:tetratricopeptide (TPR) repeat protein
MLDLANSAVTLIGRPERASRKTVAAELARTGARLAPTIASGCAALVVTHGATTPLRTGRLDDLVSTADERGVPVISEERLLRSLRLLPAPGEDAHAFSLEELARRSGLAEHSVRKLALFDLLDDMEGRFGFRDLVVARMAAELVAGGAHLPVIIEAGLQLRRLSGFRDDLSRYRLTLAPDGSVLLLQGGQPVEPGGQIRLPLDFGAAPSFEEVADGAEQAEEDGDLAAAERLYRRALQIRRNDVVCLANLATVLMARSEHKEAAALLMRAVAADPSYADAWYNLAHIAHQDGDRASMQERLEQAVRVRPDYADAVYNLAHLHFTAEEYDRAEPLWRRYLALDQSSKWAQTARRALKVCEMARLNMSA